jgi:pectate lyase
VGFKRPLYSTDDGYAISNDNDFCDGENAAEEGILTSVPYSYTMLGSEKVKIGIVGTARQTLSF